MGRVTDALLGHVSADRVVLSIVALHPGGITLGGIQEHEIWRRYTGRGRQPRPGEVADGVQRLLDQKRVHECGKKVHLTTF